ncbi:MAG: BON domain-containing protein [Limnochordia bacterium]|nr:BON domain-containing protein [Bacillota bacterium]
MNRPGACVRFLLIVLSMQLLVSGSAFAYDEQLILVQGQSRILRLDDIVRAAVGDPAVVDVAAVDSQQLLLNPLRVGITSLHVWQRTRQKEYQLRVVADDGTLLQEFLTVLNLPHVSAWFAHGHLVLEGQVSSESEKERAEKLAGAYADAVISLLRHPTDDSSQQLKQELRRLIPPEIQLTFLQSTVILEGRAESDAERHLACRLAEALGYQVIDLIEVDSEPDAGIAAPAAPEPEDADGAAEPAVLAAQIKEAIGDDLTVYIVGETVFLEGWAADSYRKERAAAIAKAFGMPVVDLIQVDEPEPKPKPVEAEPPEHVDDGARQLVDQLNRLIANPAVSARIIHGYLILEGRVESEWEKTRTLLLAQVAGLPVIDLITVSSPIPDRPDLDAVSVLAGDDPPQPPEKQLEELLEGTGVSARWIGGTLILEGAVEDEFAKTKAAALGEAFADKVVDLIRIRQPVEVVPLEPGQFAELLVRDVAAALQEPGVTVRLYQDTLVLEGIVPDAKAKERAERLASVFYQPVISFIDYPQPGQVSSADQLAFHLGLESVRVTAVGTSLVLEGTVQNAREHSRVMQIAQLYGDVVDLLVVEQPEQVLLQVHVVELDRSAGTELGINWGSLIYGLNFIADVIQFEEVAHIGSWQMNRSHPLGAQLTALEKEGKAKLLAAPALLTVSGQPASFLAGGEIPLVLDFGDQQAVEWVEYGVKLNILPLVEGEQVRIHIQPEVSSIDWNTSDRLQSRNPALNTRRTDTTVNLEHGSTVVISGLIQRQESTEIKKIPILGDLPILGTLFRSKEYQDKQTELVIFVTPWIIGEEVSKDG